MLTMQLCRMGCLLSGLLLLGCGAPAGPPRAEVQGSVTLDGQPLEQGTIALIPTACTAGPSVGGEINAGKYTIPAQVGPVAGSHRVEIKSYKQTGTETSGIAGEGGPSGAQTVPIIESLVPEQYNTKSTLTVDVKSGTNEFSFDLKSKP